jgi:hypothetical protein
MGGGGMPRRKIWTAHVFTIFRIIPLKDTIFDKFSFTIQYIYIEVLPHFLPL